MKILIIRFSSIGDIVLTTSVVRCVKEQVKNAEIHFLTKEIFFPVLEANPYINKIHLLHESEREMIRELKNEKFDLIIDLHHNIRSLRVKVALGVESRTFNKINFDKWMMVNFKINGMPSIHIVDRYFETVKSLGVKNDGKGSDYFISITDVVEMHSLPLMVSQGYVAFVIGAKHFTKRLPVKKITEICKLINKPIILLGGKEDQKAGEEIAANSEYHAWSACGLYNINQSASLIRQAISVITHDTGLMHIAAAFNKKILSIWGNTIPEFGMYPYLPSGNNGSEIMEVSGLNCRPCSKLGFEKCPQKHFNCMNLISNKKIADWANEN